MDDKLIAAIERHRHLIKSAMIFRITHMQKAIAAIQALTEGNQNEMILNELQQASNDMAQAYTDLTKLKLFE